MRATPTSGASTRKRSGGFRPNTSGSATASTPCISTSSTGVVDSAFFDKMSAQWREEQNRCQREIERHESRRASPTWTRASRFSNSRRTPKSCSSSNNRAKNAGLLNFVLSNCSWEDGEVVATFRQPFDLLAETTAIATRGGGSGSNSAKSEIWLCRQSQANRSPEGIFPVRWERQGISAKTRFLERRTLRKNATAQRVRGRIP